MVQLCLETRLDLGVGLRKKSPAELQQFPCPPCQRRRTTEETVVVLEVLERISYPVFRVEFLCVFRKTPATDSVFSLYLHRDYPGAHLDYEFHFGGVS